MEGTGDQELGTRVVELEAQVRTLQETVQSLRDIEEIKQLKAKYVRYLDQQDWQSWADEVLTDDFHHESPGQVYDGCDPAIAAITEAMAGGIATHQCHTPEIALTGPDTATGIWSLQDVTKLPGDGTPLSFHGDGHYYEEYRRTPDGWRIASNIVKFLVVEATGLPEGHEPAVLSRSGAVCRVAGEEREEVAGGRRLAEERDDEFGGEVLVGVVEFGGELHAHLSGHGDEGGSHALAEGAEGLADDLGVHRPRGHGTRGDGRPRLRVARRVEREDVIEGASRRRRAAVNASPSPQVLRKRGDQ